MQNSFEYQMFFCYAAGRVVRTGKALRAGKVLKRV